MGEYRSAPVAEVSLTSIVARAQRMLRGKLRRRLLALYLHGWWRVHCHGHVIYFGRSHWHVWPLPTHSSCRCVEPSVPPMGASLVCCLSLPPLLTKAPAVVTGVFVSPLRLSLRRGLKRHLGIEDNSNGLTEWLNVACCEMCTLRQVRSVCIYLTSFITEYADHQSMRC
jgi:hypothetical protein